MRRTFKNEMLRLIEDMPQETWHELRELTKRRVEYAGFINSHGHIVRLTRGQRRGVQAPFSNSKRYIRFHTHVTQGKYKIYPSLCDVRGLLFRPPQQGKRVFELLISKPGVTMFIVKRGVNRQKRFWKEKYLRLREVEKDADEFYDAIEMGGFSWDVLFNSTLFKP
ncbi:MAG: hypothetical protein HY376_02190 [Candidatus Blackburnbacteria bacterium]|nr:hypothetical protein [Candidatus Blackburnbacteria bacterium]